MEPPCAQDVRVEAKEFLENAAVFFLAEACKASRMEMHMLEGVA